MQNKHTHEDGTPFTKEEFLQKLKTDKEFNNEFGNKGIDQISELIKQLKDNPDSRRMVVNAWAVHDLPKMTLPPCHYGFQVYTRPTTREEKIVNPGKYRAISLMFNMRSVDTFLGLPFNIASYGLLLEIIAKEVNMVPDELIGNLGDTHLYLNHVDQAKEQIGRELALEERNEIHKNLAAHMKYHIDKLDLLKTIDYNGGLITHEILDELDIPRLKRQPFPLPKLKLDDWYSTQGDVNNSTEVIMNCLMGLNHGHITLENYQSHPTIKAPLSN